MKILTLLILVLGISVVSVSSQTKAESPEFTLPNGFGGHSEGNGETKLFLGKRHHFHVESHGFDQGAGTFRLDQNVTFQGQPSRRRTWMLKTVSPNHYAGTLSDAEGRVTGLTKGTVLLIKYRVKGPLIVHQILKLMPDGKTIDNKGKITFLGIPVGHLHETITRKD